MNSEVLTRRRLIRYLTPVIVLSILYNLNRFFEAEVRWVNDLPKISATKLRMESEAYNLSVLSIRCIVLGIFPVMILVFLNTKIYKDVQERRARNVPLGSSSCSFNRGNGVHPPFTSSPSPPIPKSRWSMLNDRMTMKRIKIMGSKYHKTTSDKTKQTNIEYNFPNSRNGVKTNIGIEEMIPLRYRISKRLLKMCFLN